ncbi:MAG: hypothetical protein LBE15_00950 [Burkholderiales bacterium]|jgi:hypothetical protein|nr:hypothetical protein [Burkholderiales bacterium]
MKAKNCLSRFFTAATLSIAPYTETLNFLRQAKKGFIPSLIAAIMAFGLLAGLPMTASAVTLTNWTFGKPLNAPPREVGSLRFQINDLGSATNLRKYASATSTDENALLSGIYCTNPTMKLWVGTDRFATATGTWGGGNTVLGDANTVVDFYADDVLLATKTGATLQPPLDPVWQNAHEQKIVVTWNKTLTGANAGKTAAIQWIVSYTEGAEFFHHEWNVSATDTATGQPASIEGGIDLYYGGHHQLGGGNQGGWSTYNPVTKSIYTWGNVGNNNGIFLFRSNGAVEPHSWYSGAANNNPNNYSGVITSAPRERTDYGVPALGGAYFPAPGTSQPNGHTSFYMHWKAFGALPAGETWKVEASEGIIGEDELSIVAPPGRTVPSGVVLSYEFQALNFHNGSATVALAPTLDAAAALAGWTAVINGPTQITLPAYGSMQMVMVDVTIPAGQPDGMEATLTLTGDSRATDSGASLSSASDHNITTIDNSIPSITEVMETNLTTLTMAVRVDYANLAGANNATIEIYSQDGTGTGVNNLDPWTAGAGNIASGGLVTDIDISMLTPGTTYRIKAMVDGIEYPHFQRFFVAPVAPTINCPASLTLPFGYAATSTAVCTIGGVPEATVSKTSGNAAITWNDVTKTLDIAAGLTSGSYPVVLTASNGISPDGTSTFTLTVGPSTDANLISVAGKTITVIDGNGSAGTPFMTLAIDVANSVTSIAESDLVAALFAEAHLYDAGFVGRSLLPQTLSVGDNEIHIIVTAEDGTALRYIVTVTRFAPMSGSTTSIPLLNPVALLLLALVLGAAGIRRRVGKA